MNRSKRVDPLSVSLLSAGAVALAPTVVKAVAAVGTILSSFFGGLLIGIAFEGDDTGPLKERIEALLVSNPKPEAMTVAQICLGNELTCLEAVLPAVREANSKKMTVADAEKAAAILDAAQQRTVHFASAISIDCSICCEAFSCTDSSYPAANAGDEDLVALLIADTEAQKIDDEAEPEGNEEETPQVSLDEIREEQLKIPEYKKLIDALEANIPEAVANFELVDGTLRVEAESDADEPRLVIPYEGREDIEAVEVLDPIEKIYQGRDELRLRKLALPYGTTLQIPPFQTVVSKLQDDLRKGGGTTSNPVLP
ncbi:hypothetical protein QR680_011920 [Steinernema hermaphroditum]|uniref:Uncharacterized protein n=1 Tax=Steinernema hermaphroditum TaxID=289476 RepID=A0AA39I072_9BILA|nr:hypothetical protein QR680_011920 [Steinernema hermaphroditum]